MRTFKVVKEDHTILRVDYTVYVVDRLTERIEENELVDVVCPDGTHMVMTPSKTSRIAESCESCCLWAINRCCAYIDNNGYYVCLFRGMPAKSIDSLLEEL